jgi:5-methylcytosine-specific restriction protein B
MPNLDVLKDMGLSNIIIDNKELDVAKMLETMNKRIEYLFDREHTIGHAFFTGLKGLKDKDALNKLATIFSENVIPLLQEYFYDDYEKIRLVLADNFKADNFKSEDYQFITQKGLNPSGNNGIFKGSTTELESRYSYEINKEAYKHIESYTEIY